MLDDILTRYFLNQKIRFRVIESDYAFTARAARNARRSAQFRMGGEGGKPS